MSDETEAETADSLAEALSTNAKLFGEPEKGKPVAVVKTPTLKPQALQKLQGQSDLLTQYRSAVSSMNAKAESYDASLEKLGAKVDDVKKTSKDGLKQLGDLVSGINYNVASISSLEEGQVLEIQFIDMMDQAYSELIDTVDPAAGQNEAAADAIKSWAADFEKTQQQHDAAIQSELDSAMAKLNGGGNGGNPGDNPGLNLGADNGLENLGKDTTIDPNTGLPTDNTSTAGDAKSKIDDAIQQIKDSAMTPNSSMASPVESPSLGSGLGGMMDPMGMGGMGMNPYMNPYGMGMGMDPYGSLGDSLRNRADDLDPNRIDRAVQPLAQAQPQQPAPSTPWSNQNNAAPVSNTAGGPPPNATSSQPGGTTPPPRVPGSDGMIEYAFPPDFQRKQKVSPVVAQALDAAFANTKGTDAKAAYSGTTAKWSDNKQVGARIDPSQLMTGDVALWDKDHAAIVVAFGSGDPSTAAAANFTGAASFTGVSGGSGDPSAGSGDTSAGSGDGSDALQVIVCGELKRFDAHMSDVGGDFGDFSGFAHPAGIEGTGAAHGDAMPAVPAPGDPSAGGPTMSALAGTQTI
ncbi:MULTISPECIES: hypothetical protein [Nocardia]|uniref:hypothetical protein n=1 Tax=Nocardia TaxID=1817 RepID=UPI0007EBCA28|nr:MULTISPECIES: hypothetical protein [Nocardia]MBF6278226.1 hypothetical protein [Nocardia nova]OBA51775.1 hypothetical protein A5789_26995 [Nocardia sp. 852002-51101_SCH5132738]OBB41793.1 hypothetical protein A5748_31210 [Nocardia sp. 852002-51244_SCH5132740]OBF83015.1 hypothetical protein A9X06_18880 [Mycobacterium sp. 852002-51759_SCH5129042]